MSVIVAIKSKNVVYLGADSQVTRGSSRSSLSNVNNYKIWKVKGVENCIMGCVGKLRDACAIRVLDNLIKEIDVIHDLVDYEYVVERIEPAIKDCHKDHEFIKSDDPYESMESRFILAYKDKLFTITYGCVLEHDDFVSIGSGECEAIGSLLSTDNVDNVEERIVKAIKASAANDIYVDYPIVLSNTDDTCFKVINERGVEEDEKQ